MSLEEQKEYLGDHPKSKLRKSATEQDTPGVFTKLSSHVRTFLHSKQAHPDSKERRHAATLIKDKSTAFVHHVKEEFIDEWKHFAKAAHAFATGKELDHQRKAIKGLAMKLVTVVGPVLLMHAGSHELVHLLPELGKEYVRDVMFTSLARAAVFAAVLAAADANADRLAQAIVEGFADYVQAGKWAIADQVKSGEVKK